MTDDILESLEPPDRPDFRRVSNTGVPMVIDPDSGKRVRYRRSSSAGKILDDESNLWDWKLRTAIVGAAHRPELMAMVSVLDPKLDKKMIRNHAEQCLVQGKGDQRKIQGIAVHAMFDHVDLGHDWVPAPQFKDLVDAYVKEIGYYGLVPEDVEVQCVNDRYRLAGTLDRRYRTTRVLIAPDGTVVPIGSYIVGDTKTGLALEYASGTYSTQAAAYVDSVRYDVTTDERTPFDPPNFPDWALCVHARPEAEKVEIYWIDIQSGRLGLALAEQVWNWRRRGDLIVPAKPPLRPVPELAPEPPIEPVEPRTELEPAAAPPEPSEAFREWLRLRVIAILDHSELAKKQLQMRWPDGMPGFKQGGQTHQQLTELMKVLDQVEADFSIPFGAPDPRIRAAMDEHPSSALRWSKPTDEPAAPEDAEALGLAISEHPRRALLHHWASEAVAGGFAQDIADRFALAHALYEFAKIGPFPDWSDDDLSEMLVGTLNALGYRNGLRDLGNVIAEDAPKIMSAAFAITAGTAMLMFDDENKPVVRFNVKQAQKDN